MQKSTKYWALAVLTIVFGVLTYISGHPGLTVDTLIGAGLVAVPLAMHDLESAP